MGKWEVPVDNTLKLQVMSGDSFGTEECLSSPDEAS